MKKLIEQSIDNSFTYTEYRNHISNLLLEGLATGNTQSEDLTHYSTLNEVRMNRLEKTIKVPEEINNKLSALKGNYIFLVLSEGWCGDAAQLVPVMKKMADAANAIELKIVLRDENDGLMEQFLTNGARSIPKLILLDADTLDILSNWGPRPEGAAGLIKEYKEKYGVINQEAKTELQKWYLHDKGLSTMNEIITLLERAEKQKATA